MVNFDSVLTYKELNTVSDDFKSLLPKLLEIETIAKGGTKLNPVDYLLIRDDEDSNITGKRIEKFLDHNYLGAAIRLQRTYQNSGVIDINSNSLPGNGKNWKKFIDVSTRKNQSLKTFLLDVFESALINKICYVQVELPKLPEEYKNLNEAQLTKVSLPSPYLFIIPVQCVMSQEIEGNTLNWIKYKRLVQINSPFSETLYNFEYVFINDIYTITWTFENVKVSKEDLEIEQIWDKNLNNGKGGYRRINEKDTPNTPIVLEHKRGKCPVLRYEIPDTLYQTEQVYRSQALIYGLSMNLLHTAANAGFIQKVLKPWLQQGGNSSSGGASYIPVPREALQEFVAQFAKSMGDESLLLAESFSFEELQGTSVDVGLKVIFWLRDYIFSTIQYSYSNYQKYSNPSIDSQSGESKIVDYSIRTLALKDHGSVLINFTKLILQHVSRAFNIKDIVALDSIEVAGMDRFDLRPIDEALSLVERIFKLPVQSLPQDLLVEVLTQLSRVIIENNSTEYKKQLNDAIINKVETYLKSLVSESASTKTQSASI